MEGERVGKKQQNTLAVSFCEPCGKTDLQWKCAKDASHKISDMIMKTNKVRIFLTLSSWKKVVL